MSRKVQMAAAGESAPPAPHPHVPRTVADRQDTGEVMLPGTREYAELVTQLQEGKITAEQFVERINKTIEKP
jgi:hypothetical protein